MRRRSLFQSGEKEAKKHETATPLVGNAIAAPFRVGARYWAVDEMAVNTGPAFWLIIAIGAAVFVGVALTYALLSRRGRNTKEVDRKKGWKG